METSSKDALGKKLSTSDQSTALAVGDLNINGIDIGATLAADGLMGKISAINKLKDQTGVTASSAAKVSFTTNSTARNEYIGNTVTAVLGNDVIGINGLGVAITAGESMQTVAANINAINSATGAKAYVDDTGHLHIYSDGPLNFSHSNVTPPTAGFFTDIGLAVNSTAAGSINIKGIDVSLSNIYDTTTLVSEINAQQARTGVSAKMDDNGQLQFFSDSTFSLKLGNTNGFKTFAALGISTGFTVGATDLSDTNSDNQLKDDRVDVQARIHLTSMTDSPIQLKLTTNGATATGFVEQNREAGGAIGSALGSINVLSVDAAQKAIGTVDLALNTINKVRANLGAANNRLDFTISNLSNVVEKTVSALSRIVDTDFAKETAKLSRASILQSAAQAMLSQANSRPSQVLSLLR